MPISPESSRIEHSPISLAARALGRSLSVPALIAVGLMTELPAAAEDSALPFQVTEQRQRCAGYDPLRRPFFGDTHVHTAYSFDASTQDTRGTPRDAYRFAKGERLGIQPYADDGTPGRYIQLDRPLDFVAVTDHAEMFGEVHLCTTPGTEEYDSWFCYFHRNHGRIAFKLEGFRTLVLKSRWGICGDDDALCEEVSNSVWKSIRDAAEEAYDRTPACRFTSFVGYEWTAIVEDGINLHRNVLFRNENVPDQAYSWLNTPTALDLWNSLQEGCVDGIPGCDALTIPHNSNISAGLMFGSVNVLWSWNRGERMTDEEIRRRSRWEPLVEIMQHKGDSECRLGLGTTDEECNFEQLPHDRFGPKFSMLARKRPPTASNFVREGLKSGLELEATRGQNPLKYGIIASTDTHIAAPGFTSEKEHGGHGGAGQTADESLPQGFPDDIEYNPGGLAVLWAEENSRDSLFEAMTRREAYGTSGSRPIVRFFGGWDLPKDMCDSHQFAADGYANGVPMGGDLAPSTGQATKRGPRFAAFALQDAGSPSTPGTPLERVQIIKGWYDGEELHEKVVTVAGGDTGASVDLSTCERRGTGSSSLCAVWEDPDFDASQQAFYYVRVLENPTCRWSQYVCLRGRVDCSNPDSVPEGLTECCSPTHQAAVKERAWTSPIWYTPEG